MINQPLPAWMNERIGKGIIKNEALFGNFDVVHLPIALISKPYVEELQAAGFLVHAANCDTEQEIRQAFESGADQLTTNSLETALLLKKTYVA